MFFENLYAKGKDTRALAGIKMLPIGQAAASLIASKGIIPDYMPDTFSSEGIVEVLKTLDITGKRFLLPRAEEARDIIVTFIIPRVERVM